MIDIGHGQRGGHEAQRHRHRRILSCHRRPILRRSTAERRSPDERTTGRARRRSSRVTRTSGRHPRDPRSRGGLRLRGRRSRLASLDCVVHRRRHARLHAQRRDRRDDRRGRGVDARCDADVRVDPALGADPRDPLHRRAHRDAAASICSTATGSSGRATSSSATSVVCTSTSTAAAATAGSSPAASSTRTTSPAVSSPQWSETSPRPLRRTSPRPWVDGERARFRRQDRSASASRRLKVSLGRMAATTRSGSGE